MQRVQSPRNALKRQDRLRPLRPSHLPGVLSNAEQSADALVNAAGTSLEMGSGAAGALRDRAGEELNEEATEKGPIDLGDAAVTDAYDLDAEYVVHAAAMPHYGDGRATEESIRDATRSALENAAELQCRSLVMPALGCGVAEGAEIIGEEIESYEPDHLEDVRLIGYSDTEYDAMRAATGKATESQQGDSEADR